MSEGVWEMSDGVWAMGEVGENGIRDHSDLVRLPKSYMNSCINIYLFRCRVGMNDIKEKVPLGVGHCANLHR